VPPWRQRVEALTELAIGVGANVAEMVRPAEDDASAPVTDVFIGITLDGQRLALDAGEQLVGATSAAARTLGRVGPVRALVARMQRALEPVEVRGRTVRLRSVRDLRANAPRYANQMVEVVTEVVSIDLVLDRVDIDALLARIDIDALLARVNVQGIIDRVDIQEIIDRVDIQGLIDRVDVNKIVGDVDLEGLVERTEIGAIIARSTGGVASEALDLVRRQGVGLDGFVARWAARVDPRLRSAPSGPKLLVPAEDSA